MDELWMQSGTPWKAGLGEGRPSQTNSGAEKPLTFCQKSERQTRLDLKRSSTSSLPDCVQKDDAHQSEQPLLNEAKRCMLHQTSRLSQKGARTKLKCQRCEPTEGMNSWLS